MTPEDCLRILAERLPADTALPTIHFGGDPAPDTSALAASRARWLANAWTPAVTRALPSKHNLFVGISAFHPPTGTPIMPGKYIRRSKDNFAAMMAVMIDDLGDGPGAKIPKHRMRLAPTWLVETSPGNHQAWYVLSEPCTDRDYAEAFIKALIADGLASDNDPGMAGVSRVGRLPGGINGKAKYGGSFQTRIADWNPERRFTLAQIQAGYYMRSIVVAPPRQAVKPPPGGAADVLAACVPVILEYAGRFLEQRTGTVWHPMICPWRNGHTNGDISGTAYAYPSAENHYLGGFHCHHGTCTGRNIGDLRRWAAQAYLQMTGKSL